MSGPLILAPAAPLVVGGSTVSVPLVLGGGLVLVGGGALAAYSLYQGAKAGGAATVSIAAPLAGALARPGLEARPQTIKGGPMARKKSAYQKYLASRLGELRAEGYDQANAMRIIGDEWRAKKGSSPSSAPPQSRYTGGSPRNLRLSVPYETPTAPSRAATIDIAEGLLDGLIELTQPVNSPEAILARADAEYARLRGEGAAHGDMAEYELGQAIAASLQTVVAHRRMSPQDWVNLMPTTIRLLAQLDPNASAISLQGRGAPPEDEGLFGRAMDFVSEQGATALDTLFELFGDSDEPRPQRPALPPGTTGQ